MGDKSTGYASREPRENLAAWVRYFHEKYLHEFETQQEFAREIGVAFSTLSNILNGKRLPGLEVLLRPHTRFGKDYDLLLHTAPPRGGETANPHTASAPGQGRRRRAGGH